MIRIVESRDDYHESQLSNGSSLSIFCPPLTSCIDTQPRKSLSYNKFFHRPLSLTVLKLDGSSFGIQVKKSGTVGEVKRAVEAAFRHLPRKGPGKVSWPHVWGQFCLCHEGQKLLNDTDYIGMFGIKDGDQLQFIHQPSNSYNLVSIQSEKEDFDSDDEPSGSNGYRNEQDAKDIDCHRIEIVDDYHIDVMESDDGPISKCEAMLSQLLKGFVPYRKLPTYHVRLEKGTSSSRFSCKGSFKKILCFYNNKSGSMRETWKGK